MHLTDVVVIGAGPSGSALAYTLTKGGASVVVLDRGCRPGESNTCGGVIPKSLAEEIELPRELIHRFHMKQIHHFPGERLITEVSSGGYVATTRPMLDSFLIQRAEKSGAHVLLGANAFGVEEETGEVTYRQDGRVKRIQGSLIAYADGPGTLARKHGLGFDPLRQDYALCCVAEVQCENLLDEGISYHYPPELHCGYIWAFPKSDHVNVGICESHRYTRGSQLRSTLELSLGKKIPGVRQAVFRRGLFPRELACRVSARRELVLGDAAGLVDPIGGGGIPYAVASGVLAGELILDRFTPARYAECLRSTANYQMIRLLRQLMDYHMATSRRLESAFIAIRKWHLHIRTLSRTIGFPCLVPYYADWIEDLDQTT